MALHFLQPGESQDEHLGPADDSGLRMLSASGLTQEVRRASVPQYICPTISQDCVPTWICKRSWREKSA